MTDTDTTITIGPWSSTFDRLSPDFGDPDPTDLDRLAASLDYLTLCCCEPGTDEADKHLPLEAVAMDEQLLVGAVPAAGEQL
jgi:hypothetical protein